MVPNPLLNCIPLIRSPSPTNTESSTGQDNNRDQIVDAVIEECRDERNSSREILNAMRPVSDCCEQMTQQISMNCNEKNNRTSVFPQKFKDYAAS